MILKVEGDGLPNFRVQGGKLNFDDNSGGKIDFFPIDITHCPSTHESLMLGLVWIHVYLPQCTYARVK
jgi:hypothetical protein